METTKLQRKKGMGATIFFRLIISLLLISFISATSTAQPVEYRINETYNPWFVGLGVGPRIYFADHTRQLGISDRISGGADLYLGKWWNEIVGTRVGASWQTLRGATKYRMSSVISGVRNPGHSIDNSRNPYVGNGHNLWRQQFDAYHLYADLLFNVSTLFQGDYEDRFWTLVPFIGIGYISTWDHPSAKELTMNVGLLNTLRVGNNVDLVFDIRGNMFKDRFKNPVFDPNKTINQDINNDTGQRPYDGILSVNIGVHFRFGGSGTPRAIYRPASPYVEIPPVAPVIETEIEVIREWKDVASDVLILFRIGQSTLSRDARVQLGFLARLMHEFPESRYTITGYADEGTGNPDLNYRLSNDRAKRAKDCLVNEFGISPARLNVAAAGGIENRYYNDPSLSRSVIIRPDKN
jgi:hypothetical protein